MLDKERSGEMFDIFSNMNSITLIMEALKALLFIFIGILVYRLIDRKSAKKNQVVKQQAFTDQLTGRGNRYMFFSVIDKLIKKNRKFAVCFMDLDGFKQINDSMGHDAGDELLVSLSDTFETKLPKNSTAYRLGGDEFAILIDGIKTTEDITKVLDDLKENLKVPFVIGNTNITLEYSLGIAIYPEDADNRQDLIMYADDAMYHIKTNGKNDYYFHNKVLRAKLENKNKMQKDLKAAYEKQEFGVDFQPRIDINDTSQICFETLLYWNHPVLGKIPSNYFIKQADETAMTIKLDNYVLDMVCKQINKFNESGNKNIKIAVNISNKHIEKKDFIDKICNTINENSIEPGQIQIEFTDTIDIDKIEKYKIMFEKLKECGAEIIINNFEIKYEAIQLFTELPIDELKISSDFISVESKVKPELFVDVINLAKDMNLKVLITSIENEKQLNKSIKCGADKIQGNFLFKRMDIKLTEEFVNEYGRYINRLDGIIITAKNIKNIL